MGLRKFKHMFKNSYKNATKNKTQLFGVIVLVFLLSLVLTTVVSLNNRVINQYQTILKKSRLHDVIIDLNPYESVSTGETLQTPDAPKNAIEAQQYWVYKLQEKYASENPDLEFDWSRTEAREFSQVKNKDKDLTLKTLVKTTQSTQTNSLNSDGVDKLIIFEGQDIKTRHQVVIDQNFAKANGIKIGNVIRIQVDNLGDSFLVKESNNDKSFIANIQGIEATINKIDEENSIYNTYYSNYQWFQVVGYGSSADFLTPIVSESTPLPNRNQESIIYMSLASFGLEEQSNGLFNYDLNAYGNLNVNSNIEQESFYSLKFKNGKVPNNAQLDEIETDFRELIKRNINKKLVYSKSDATYRFSSRVNFLIQTVISYSIAAFIIFISILVVVLYSVSLITKKQIENASRQLGTLKALGYRKRVLVFNFIMLPLFTSLIGGIAGYFASIFISNLITGKFANYFNLNYKAFVMDWISFVIMIGVIWLILTTISFVISVGLMKQSSLSLISKINDKKPSKLKFIISKIRIRRSFGAKIRKALLVDALGKMFGIGLVVLLSAQLFTISFAAPNILKQNQKYSLNGVKYKQIVEYSEPSYNNPLSFMKTFKASNAPTSMKYGKVANGWTTLKLTNDGAIDMDQIMSDYFNENISSDYYSIFVDSYINQSKGNVIPTLLEFALANMKMLNLEGVVFDTNYFKEISKYGIPNVQKNDTIANFLLPTIISQWFDYQSIFSSVKKNNQLENKNKAIVENAKVMQSFYKKQSSTIGLSITNDFRVGKHSNITDEQWVNQLNTSDKINVFNDSSQSAENLNLKEEYLNNNVDLLKTLLLDQEVSLVDQDLNFQYTNTNWNMGEFRIQDNNNKDPLNNNDYYVGINFDSIDKNNEEQMKIVVQSIEQYWKWFTFMCYNRVDQSIIQTAFSRPPYFVKQNISAAYESNDKNYSMAFNLVQFDKDLESLGTKINAQKNNFDFKIYGIENENRFLDLFDQNKNDLIDKLYSNKEDNGIIINQSLAKVLKIKEGEEVDFDVIQKEMQQNDNGDTQAYNLNDWDTTGLWSGINGFKQNAQTQKFANINIKTPMHGNTNAINFLSSISAPSNFYRTILDGKTIISQKKFTSKFKVVGIHDGYGTAQAWVKNSYANKVLGYDKVQDYLWKNIFSRQWNNEFGFSNSVITAKTKIILEDEANEDIRVINKIKDFDLTKNDNDDFEVFKAKYLNSSNNDEKALAKLIIQIFEKQYPVFNYKYSNSDDIGDFQTAVSVSNVYGDYSPTALNGLSGDYSSTGESFDGSASGATSWLLPVDTYKEILDEVSRVILTILILVIFLIVAIAFVIILLTTSIIINDNIRFISTMRVLGYTDRYVVRTVMGMYAIVITSMFVIGYVGGWYLFMLIVNTLAKAGIVLPLSHPIWLPIVVLIGIMGIYAIAIWAGYRSITKINSVKVLQNSDI